MKPSTSEPARRPSRTWAWIALTGVLTLLAADFIRSLVAREAPRPAEGLYARDNLIAWCIVPFDSKHRTPEERAAMLERLGFKHFAYDWRAEHVPTFDAEVEALKKHGVALDAFWVAPGELNDASRKILDVLKRHDVKAQLWCLLDLGADKAEGAEQERRIDEAVRKLKPLADEADEIGCTVALYNHGGWFGEPENQIAVIERLKKAGAGNVGMVYNFHHGHDHLGRIKALLGEMMPYLTAININGMDPEGDRHGRKILPLGQGELDLELLRTIRDSGYRGPIGVLGHTMDDAEARLKDNLDGLDWLVARLDGKPAGPRPTPRTPTPPRPAPAASASPLAPDQAAQVAAVVAAARKDGDPARGAVIFADPRFSCLPCHKVGDQGGSVGPELTTVGRTVPPEELAESFLWPRRKVKEGYDAIAVAVDDGRLIQGYKQGETDAALTVRDAALGAVVTIPKESIEETKPLGTLMPEGLAATMTPGEQADLLSFLMMLGSPGGSNHLPTAMPAHGHTPPDFPYDRAPLQPEFYGSMGHPVNRQRIYDYYAKEADYFRKQPSPPMLLPTYPGLDGGVHGHWGNQNESTWADARWNETDLGSVMCGVFRGAGVTIPKGVCLRLGDRGEFAACFDPQTLCYEAFWAGGFVRFSDVRHGFMEGLILDGEPLPRPDGVKPDRPFVYNGFYRHGDRVLISYSIDGEEWLDAPSVEDGEFVRNAAPAAEHQLRALREGGPAQWPQLFVARGKLGTTRPYATDTIAPPFDNPWNALLFFGGLGFQADGTALLSTMQGDVWRVEGLDDGLEHVAWRRIASGLHQALGLVVADGKIYVLGRDQITELQDRNGDGEADYYRCVNNAYTSSPAGHDFVCGLERDARGDFYTASGPQGLIRVPGDGGPAETIATGFRNPDGLCLTESGVLTVPNSEGNWVPTSMICEVSPGAHAHYGYPGPKDGQPPSPPLVYLPRALDNSSGGQVEVAGDRWGPLKGCLVHFSYGAGAAFLVIRDHVDGVPQGAVAPLPGDFLSGVHRGRFNPRDGQLYVAGMAGWGSYTALDGCFQRVRYTGDPVQSPVRFHPVENGVLVGFTRPVDPSVAARPGNAFAQAWNYRYSSTYGSREYSTRHPGVVGHDPLPIRSVHVLPDGKTLFLEIPDVQPVNQLHLRLEVDDGPAHELYATINKLAPPFTEFEGYRPARKTIAAHPILADMAALNVKKEPNPWLKVLPKARMITIAAGNNLTYTVPSFKVKAGETIKLRFQNPDVVPHNWVLAKPGSLARVGELVNKIIAEPDAAARNYIPRTDDVLVYADIIAPGSDVRIYFKAPTAPGRYPYLCTFPGHWMVMNGVMTVE